MFKVYENAIDSDRNKMKLGKIDCKICGLVCENYYFYQEHRKEHMEMQCQVCNKHFLNYKSLRSHVKSQHINFSRYVTCKHCNKLIKESYLHTHMKKVHFNGKSQSVNCDICNKTFKNKEAVRVHKVTVHIDCAIPCNLCDKKFKNKYILNSHIHTSHSDKSNICSVCGKSVKCLASHMKITHTQRVKKKCDICGNIYADAKLLKIHRKRKHEDIEREHVCKLCGASFKFKELLKNHGVVHSDERKYKCDICDKAFKLPIVLKTHKRVHNNVAPYCCEYCGDSFKWKQTYDKHLTKCTAAKDN